jgi:hypothetical protein
MGGRFIRFNKLMNVDPKRNCPRCGKDIELRTHPEEVIVRLLTIAAVIAAGYWAKVRGGGYLVVLLAFTAGLLAMYAIASLLLRNKQRFQKATFGR